MSLPFQNSAKVKIVVPSFRLYDNLVPRASFPLTSGRRTRALGANLVPRANSYSGRSAILKIVEELALGTRLLWEQAHGGRAENRLRMRAVGSFWRDFRSFGHREHTLLLNRKRVNKEMT